MGRIITYHEILDGYVPTGDSFVWAKEQALNGLRNLYNEGKIQGAQIYGSVANQSANKRSDMDLVVIAPPGSQPGLKKLFYQIYKDTKVPVEAQVVSKDLGNLGIHTFDPLFMKHLEGIYRSNIVGTHPLQYLKPINTSFDQVHREYIAQKTRRFAEGNLARSKEDKLRSLQRALELPANLGRRTLQTLDAMGVNVPQLATDGKKDVVDGFYEFAKDKPLLLHGFEYLLSCDQEYNNLLEAAINGEVGEAEYNRNISLFEMECIPQASIWTQDVGVQYNSQLEGLATNPEGKWPSRRER